MQILTLVDCFDGSKKYGPTPTEPVIIAERPLLIAESILIRKADLCQRFCMVKARYWSRASKRPAVTLKVITVSGCGRQ